MAILLPYTTGTASVNGGLTTVTGSGTAWKTAGFQSGDQFWAAGLTVTIDSVDSDTQVTLASGWPGSTISAGSYELRAIAVGDRANADFIKILKSLASGNLPAIADLTSAADKLPYFDGAGTADLATLTAFMRTLLDDADASTALTTLGVSAFAKTLLDDADGAASFATQGAAQSLTTNGYQKFPSGFIIQWGVDQNSTNADRTVTFPIAFPNACVSASALTYSDGATVTFFMLDDLTKPSMTVRSRKYDGTSTLSWCFWLAVGF